MSLYTFELHCPRCKKDSTVTLDRADKVDDLVVNCGDCLMEAIEVVKLTIERVEVRAK